MTHSLEGMRIRCDDKFAVVKNGRCGECGQAVELKSETLSHC